MKKKEAIKTWRIFMIAPVENSGVVNAMCKTSSKAALFHHSIGTITVTIMERSYSKADDSPLTVTNDGVTYRMYKEFSDIDYDNAKFLFKDWSIIDRRILIEKTGFYI